jgi:hypothetical protein
VLAETVDRILSHLEANKINIGKNPLRVGPLLDFDVVSERFKGEHGDWANMFIKRLYRPPFVVPELV